MSAEPTTVSCDADSPAKPIHMAGRVRSDGAMSAACYRTPRPIDLAISSWTLRPEAVTCPKCRRVIDGKRA